MTQTSPLPHGADLPTVVTEEGEGRAPAALPREPERLRLAPQWLQAVVIVALLGSAVYVWLDGWRLWAGALTVAGLAFGASFLLRRMVRDDYGRA